MYFYSFNNNSAKKTYLCTQKYFHKIINSKKLDK